MRGHSTQKAEDRRWALRIGKAATGGFVRATKAGSRSLPPGAHAEAGTTSPRTPTLAAASSWNAHEGMASASRKRARAPRSLGARSSKPSPGNRAPARAACASWTAWCSTASCSTSATSRAARSPRHALRGLRSRSHLPPRAQHGAQDIQTTNFPSRPSSCLRDLALNPARLRLAHRCRTVPRPSAASAEPSRMRFTVARRSRDAPALAAGRSARAKSHSLAW